MVFPVMQLLKLQNASLADCFVQDLFNLDINYLSEFSVIFVPFNFLYNGMTEIREVRR